MGVPVVGCTCEVCRSEDPRDRRLRTSGLLNWEGTYLLIDTGPDLRQQLLAVAASDSLPADCVPRPRVDAVLYTHAHADHVHGLDDLRSLNFIQRGPIPVYGHEATLREISGRFAYAFGDGATAATARPSLLARPVRPGVPVAVGGVEVLPLVVDHGRTPCLGWRVGSMAWCTDLCGFPPASVELLQGLDVLILGALRDRPHPTHLTIDQAVAWAERLAPRRTYLVHVTHDVCHAEVEKRLPEGVRLARDGLIIDLD